MSRTVGKVCKVRNVKWEGNKRESESSKANVSSGARLIRTWDRLVTITLSLVNDSCRTQNKKKWRLPLFPVDDTSDFFPLEKWDTAKVTWSTCRRNGHNWQRQRRMATFWDHGFILLVIWIIVLVEWGVDEEQVVNRHRPSTKQEERNLKSAPEYEIGELLSTVPQPVPHLNRISSTAWSWNFFS